MRLDGDDMLVGIKNASKLIGISIIACCAVLVCTMFLNFYFDVRLIESEITSEVSMFFYNAQVSSRLPCKRRMFAFNCGCYAVVLY